jgi:YebC/PmpR family DNA-binding regulatory protein
MGGHSHWSTIKRKKGAADQKRGKLFSKLTRAISIAARNGGGDPDMNIRLRHAIDTARSSSVPKDNIERAIQKGTGELEGETLQEITYEGYGPCGVAMIIMAVTDNVNRTAPEIRKLFEQHNGNLGGSGATAWMFKRKGLVALPKDAIEEDALYELVLEAGAEDVVDADSNWEVLSDVDSFEAVRKAIEGASLEPEVVELTFIADNEVELDAESQKKVLALMDGLEDHDDVQNVYAAFTPGDDVLAELAAG